MQKPKISPLYPLLLLLAVLTAYWPGLGGSLLFDDTPALAGNELVQIGGESFDQWRVAALSSNSGPLKRPLAMLTFAANHVAAGTFSAFALKVTNLAIHIFTAVLLYFLFCEILAVLDFGHDTDTRRQVALLAAAIWLLHPLNVSTVLYAVQRMAQLAGLFAVAGLLVFVRYRRRWALCSPPAGELFAAVLWLLLLTVLAALSKENGALLPWLIVVLEVCIFRGAWAGRPNRYLALAGWVLLILPVLVAALFMLLSPETLTAGYAGREFDLQQRVMTQVRLLWRYIGWICIPNINDMGFQHDDIPVSTGLFKPFTTALALGTWALTLGLVIVFRRRYPLLLLAVLFFLVGHSMESTVLPLEMVYEHRNYLPGMMICLVLASVVILSTANSKKIGLWYPVIGVIAVLWLLLFIRAQTWSDELTLSRINLAQHPESSRSNYFYANALLRHYRRGEQLGLDQSEKSDSLLLSRHYFERMYQANNRDVAALVMLFYLDSHYFTQLQERVDWLGKIETLVETRVLQPSDWNALATLFDIFSSGADVASESRVLGILDTLSSRYPGSANVLRYRYQYLSSRNLPSRELLPMLQQAQELAPGATWVYYAALGESARGQDVAGMYDSARLWMRHDPQRYSLHQLKFLFDDTRPLTGAPHE